MELSEMKERLLEDLKRLRAREGYLRAGWPRFDTLFGRDSLIAAWQMMEVDPTIADRTLRVLAKYQGQRVFPAAEEEPGKILHEHRFDPSSRSNLPQWDFPYYGSVDSTPLFLIVAEVFVRQTDDPGFLDGMWDSFVAAHRWMCECGSRDAGGYLTYRQNNPRALLHQGWKDGEMDHLRVSPPVAIVEAQGYAYAAHRAFASLASIMGRTELMPEAEERSEGLKQALNRDFWMAEERFYALALDGERRQRKAITSNPGHLLFSGAIQESNVQSVVARLFQDDLWTPFGIRTHASSEPDFDPFGYHTGTVWPHDNWVIYKGLQAVGFQREAARIREALLRAYGQLGKIPELYAVVNNTLVDLSGTFGGMSANPLQAWSSAGLLEMIWND